MSSSGLIYAGIVGAWAVYLVPVWLRREEQLNEAREKARYAAAIRTLGRSERFEKKVLAEEALAPTGTDGVGIGNPRSANAGPAGQSAPRKKAEASSTSERPAAAPKAKPSPAAQARKGVTAHLPHRHDQQTTKQATATAAARHRGVLLMRRRRVVAALFTLATLGAVVSVFLGVAYTWAMIAPAALFSAYIVYIRRDEKLRAKERYRRRQSVQAAERRRERQRQAEQRPTVAVAATPTPAAPRTAPSAPTASQPVVTEPEDSVWRPAAAPQEYRRAANG